LNISNFKTLPGLALAIYTSHYIPSNLIPDFKLIKGELEREIRTAYYGGNVDVFINKITNGYYYDLNKIFGFVYGEIFCPDEQTLQVPFIQYKDPIWKFNSCPRGKFKRLIFSEEIKYALNYGYKFNAEYCYQFKRGKDLFKKYVDDHFEIKSSTTDPVKRAIAKLFLNSLYGRMGMKNIENVMEIIDKKEAEKLDKNSNVSIFSELGNDKYLIRYSGKINDNIRKLYKNDPLISKKNKFYNKEELKKSGLNKTREVPSAVHIAAAISSYARIIINEYKNIPGNPCIMSDTDSVVLTKPLSDKLVGRGLGQMKLEHEIKKGIFIRKKLYFILGNNNQEIIKASGLDSNKLNYNSFLILLQGEPIEIDKTSFNLDWKSLNISVVNSIIKVQGLTGIPKTIYNTKDVNFKAISFSIKYNIIVHPKYSIQINLLKRQTKVCYSPETNKINLNQILEKDTDFFILFSNLEIIVFFIFLNLFIFFILIYIFFIK